MTPLSIETRETASALVVRVTGDLGVGSGGNASARSICEHLQRALDQADGSRIVLDLSGMHYAWNDAIGAVFHMSPDNVAFVLNRDCAEAWNGLLSFVNPGWPQAYGARIRFESASTPGPDPA